MSQKTREDFVFRSIAFTTALGVMMLGIGSADAAKYCASYKGGAEKAEARSQCEFASLKACRDSVRERGGGHCYKKARMR